SSQEFVEPVEPGLLMGMWRYQADEQQLASNRGRSTLSSGVWTLHLVGDQLQARISDDRYRETLVSRSVDLKGADLVIKGDFGLYGGPARTYTISGAFFPERGQFRGTLTTTGFGQVDTVQLEARRTSG
ncbi:MAG: hypothetical protein AAF752_11875, partial [Bacteroidota bacterium]